MQGSTFGHYRILEQLGSGGMGVVYRAEDVRLGRHVALKFLPDHLSSEDALERFRREARTASSLNHPNICIVHDIGGEAGKSFIVMELLEGQTLRERLARGAVPWTQAVDYGRQIADALSAAHERGIVHRDLKPANIFVTTRGQLKVLDFGLAKLRSERVETVTAVETAFQTTSGTTLGTVAYMSPEQARGEEVDSRSDVYSFGVVIYEMLTGRVPFTGATHALIFDGILHGTPESIRNIEPGVPAELERMVMKALEKDRRMRYQTAADLGADLTRLKRDSESGVAVASPAVARPGRKLGVLAAAALVTIAVIAAGVVFWTSRRPAPITSRQGPLVEKQITANPPGREVSTASISRDGRMVAFSDPRGIALYLRETGETRVLSDTAGLDVQGWLSDSRLLAARNTPTGQEWWAVSMLGGKQRAEFSITAPDAGSAIGIDRELRQMWASTRGGSRRTIFDGRKSNEFVVGIAYLHNGRLALMIRANPAGRLVFESVKPESGRREVVMEFSDRGRQVTGGAAVERGGRVVYAQQDGVGRRAFSLWSITVDEATGRRTGEPERITTWNDVVVYNLSVSVDGKTLALLRSDDQGDVAIGDLVSSGRLAGPPRRLSLDDRNDFPTAWADDNTVLFVSNRLGTNDIYRQSVDGDSAELLVGGPEPQSGARRTPDKKTFLFNSLLEDGRQVIRRLSLSGGVPEDVARPENLVFYHCGERARCIIVEREDDKNVVYDLDPVKGKGAKLVELHWTERDPVVSPDGTQLAYLSFDSPVASASRLKVLTIADRSVTTLDLPGLPSLSSLDWAPDGEGFYATHQVRADSLAGGATLYYIPRKGKPVAVYSATEAAPVWAVPSHDGKRLAFHTRTHKRNVWTLENF
jgi:eukaryotic-like serine/threonine-protein kinase